MTIDDICTDGQLIIQSQINGSFYGSNDETLFTLVNGQFWIQTQYKYWYHYSYMPKVSVYNFHGSYYLIVDGQNHFVQVERLTDIIQATIINDFNGWSGNTIFELDNGQIWKQAEYAYSYQYALRPQAIIHKSYSGYKLRVEQESVRVIKLK